MLIQGFKRNNIEWRTVKNIKAENMFSLEDWSKIFTDISSYLEINKTLSLGVKFANVEPTTPETL